MPSSAATRELTVRRRDRSKGRREAGRFALIPHAVMDSPNYLAVSAHAIRLLLELVRQFNGYSNNGDLAAPWSLMARRGWKSRDTLAKALAELQHYGLIERTAQGGMHKPNLYALTWAAIDPCGGKLDVSETSALSSKWRVPVGKFGTSDGKRKGQHAERVATTRPAVQSDPEPAVTRADQHGGRVVQAETAPEIDTPGVSLLRSSHGGTGELGRAAVADAA